MILLIDYSPTVVKSFYKFRAKSCESKPTLKEYRLTDPEGFRAFTSRPEIGLDGGIASVSIPVGYSSEDGSILIPYGKAIAIQSGKDKTWFI